MGSERWSRGRAQAGDEEVPTGNTFAVPPEGIPEGWTGRVDRDDGPVPVTPPADAEPGTSVDIPIEVT
ncbi:YPDG domain-containing protein [Staphylococcus felis]|uniref:YPDG domain-containing protein n=1 Tax=Staphylococcus felis TaxID=46127 RepID=UPI00115BE2E3|nr:YPDG domain-containing protein [Staphylococcus felis]